MKTPSKRSAQQAEQSRHARQEILDFIVAGDGVENDALQMKFSMRHSTIKKHLYALRDGGLIGFIKNPTRTGKHGSRGKWAKVGTAPAFVPRAPNPERIFETRRTAPTRVGVHRDPLVAAFFGEPT